MKKFCLVIAGASGVGKSTVAELLISQSGAFELSISATTRAVRAGSEGEYIYLSKEEFMRRISEGEMLEYTVYGENFYGTPLSEIERIAQSGKNPLLILDLEGVKSLKSVDIPYPVYAFYIYDDINVIEQRLYDRELSNSPTVEKLQGFVKRKNQNLSDFLRLSELEDVFDAFVKNESPDACAADILDKINLLAEGGKFSEKQAIAEALANCARAKLQ